MKRLVALPVVFVAFIEGYLAISGLIGTHPLWRATPVSSLAEATAFRDGLEIVRRLDSGEDPNRPGSVRAGWLDGETRIATPLEAAVVNRRPELIELLLSRGASLDQPSWRRLHCAAISAGFSDVVTALAAARPAGATDACTGNEGFW